MECLAVRVFFLEFTQSIKSMEQAKWEDLLPLQLSDIGKTDPLLTNSDPCHGVARRTRKGDIGRFDRPLTKRTGPYGT